MGENWFHVKNNITQIVPFRVIFKHAEIGSRPTLILRWISGQEDGWIMIQRSKKSS